MKYSENDDSDNYMTVGDLKEYLKEIPDDLKIFIERVNDIDCNAFDLERREIPDEKSPNDMIYKFVRGIQMVAYCYGDSKRDGLYITAFENN